MPCLPYAISLKVDLQPTIHHLLSLHSFQHFQALALLHFCAVILKSYFCCYISRIVIFLIPNSNVCVYTYIYLLKYIFRNGCLIA